MQELKLTVEGMHCAHCVQKVEQALAAQPGVVVKKVEIGTAVVDYDPATASLEAMAGAVAQAGYSVKRTAA